jgi:hypothetical protein
MKGISDTGSISLGGMGLSIKLRERNEEREISADDAENPTPLTPSLYRRNMYQQPDIHPIIPNSPPIPDSRSMRRIESPM